MTTLIPSASSCHTLQLPPTEKDDRLNLIVRTGSCSTLYNSLILTFGGLTIGLELIDITIPEIQSMFTSKILNSNLRFKTFDKYLSGEFFYLKLIDRTWRRVELNDESGARPKPRLFHEICAINNHAYIFGGLILNDTNNLIPCNDLWEFNLQTSSWKLLHDGNDWESNPLIPQPRFNHKLTDINSLTFVNQGDHFGLFIAGGKDANAQEIYDNYCFDLVDKKYVGQDPIHLKVTTGNQEKDLSLGLQEILNVNAEHLLNVNYLNSIIVNVDDDLKNHNHHVKLVPESSDRPQLSARTDSVNSTIKAASSSSSHEGPGNLIVYTPTREKNINPLISFKLSKQIKNGKPLPLHRKRGSIQNKKTNQTLNNANRNIPYNLRYPTGGLFGQNLVITGFLPNEYDISIFIFNIPTGKWSRLNIFCNHDYGSHRFWGGFAWQSHHKVVLIGNYVTSKTTSSIRFFTTMITVSLPITNILASSELAHGHHSRNNSESNKLTENLSQIKKSAAGVTTLSDEKQTTESDSSSSHMFTEDDDSSSAISNEENTTQTGTPTNRKNSSISTMTENHNASISFNEYAHYAAPKTKTSKIRSVFPPAAITLGRNALERYGDLISDFEMVSSSGDRIPVSLTVLIERWGKYFIRLLAKGYVKAVDKFDLDMSQDKANSRLGTSKSSLLSASSSKLKTSISTFSASSFSSEGGSSDDQINKNFTKVHSESVEELNKKETSTPKEKTSYHLSMPIMTSKQQPKDAPLFRLPFQDTPESSSREDKTEPITIPVTINPRAISHSGSPQKPGAPSVLIDQPIPPRRGSTSSFTSNNSSLLTSHLQDIPPQLPLPQEQIPAVPTTPVSFKNPSWRGSNAGHESPRASLLHTLTALRNISTSRSPRDSPYTSPRASVSAQGNTGPPQSEFSASSMAGSRSKERAKSIDGSLSEFGNFKSLSQVQPQHDLISKKKNSASYSSLTTAEGRDRMSTLTPSTSISSSQPIAFNRIDSFGDDNHYGSESSSIPFDYTQQEENQFGNSLLNFEGVESGNFRMEPSLIPRKLYIPFSTVTLKAFTEYLYTGQVGNKWLLVPTALDNLAIGRFFNVPLLYDLISEVLFGIIGRKEAYIIKEGRKLKKKYLRLHELTHTAVDPNFTFALDRYEGFLDTIDDGYLDIALLKNNSKIHKNSSLSTTSGKNKRSLGSSYSYKSSYGGNSDLRENNSGEIDAETSSPKTDLGSRKQEHRASMEGTESLAESSRTNMDCKSGKSDASSLVESRNADIEVSSNVSGPKENIWTDEHPPIPDITKEDVDALAPELLEDSSDKLTSTSEEENDFGLGFLETNFVNTNINPRSKSVFDKAGAPIDHATVYENGEEKEPDEEDALAGLVLEQLVSPYAPVPHDVAIDAIYETAAIVTDLKLMLRAANAREMTAILAQERIELGEAIRESKLKYERQKEEVEEELSEPHSDLSSMYTEYKRSQSQTSLSHPLTKVPSPSDLQLKSKTTGLSRLTPSFTFTKSKTESRMGGFNEFDKKISKLKKKNDKEQAKHDRVERARIDKIAKLERLEKLKAEKIVEKQSKLDKMSSEKLRRPTGIFELPKSQSVTAFNDNGSLFSTTTQTSTGTSKKHSHGFFHIGHRKKDKPEDITDDASVNSKLTRTVSLANSVNSDTSKHSNSTTNSKSVKGLFGFTKRI